MNTLDNKLLFQLYDELDKLIEERKHLKQYRDVPEGTTLEEALQELDEEEYYLRAKIEELSIVQSDFMEEEF